MRKLPILQTVNAIYANAFGHLNVALALAWPWLAVMAVAYLGLYAAGIPVSVDFGPEGQYFSWPRLMALILVGAIYAYGFAAIAVGWHRFQILGELPKGLGILNSDKRSWRYLLAFIGICFLLALVMIVPGIFLAIIMEGGIAGTAGNSLIYYILIAAVMFVFAVLVVYLTRAFLRLVAIALGNDSHTFSHVWKASKGNIIPILLVSIATQLPFSVVEWLASYLNVVNGEAAGVVWNILYYVNMFVSSFVGIVMLTKLYEFFVLAKES